MGSFIHIQETDSTNNHLKKLLLSKSLEEGTLVYTDFQTAGKGQRGNTWESEQGKNLMCSIILYPNMIKANEQFIISQIVSLAVAYTLNKYADDISIKWPNDIYWREKKICGILIENALEGDNIKEAICGIGININQTIFKSNAPNPISLKQATGIDFDLNTILDELHHNITDYYDKIKTADPDSITNKYKKALFRKEGYHLYNDGKSNFYAAIKDVKSDGILILTTEEGEERHFAFKEVSYIINKS
ncbi:MAG: biotin--[acetyl-CoA-carboxylase] ligase [Dysgonomonas sp.]